MTLRFSKYEGIGNDFLVVDADAPEADRVDRELAMAACDRHLGVGADGVLVAGTDDGSGRPFMRVYNADGSRPEMCGNGIRCVALHLVRTGRIAGREVGIETQAGLHACRVLEDGERGQVEVVMRAPIFDPGEIPVRADGPLVDAPFTVDDRELRLTVLSMGNPHAVVFDDVGEARRELGPKLERDPRFPEGANVGFASLRDGVQDRTLQRLPSAGGGAAASGPFEALDLEVWERGVGWTRACGTGACAAAVAAVETGRASRGAPVNVCLPGGTLTIVVPERGEPVRMTGPARHVFDGAVSLEGLRT